MPLIAGRQSTSGGVRKSIAEFLLDEAETRSRLLPCGAQPWIVECSARTVERPNAGGVPGEALCRNRLTHTPPLVLRHFSDWLGDTPQGFLLRAASRALGSVLLSI